MEALDGHVILIWDSSTVLIHNPSPKGIQSTKFGLSRECLTSGLLNLQASNAVNVQPSIHCLRSNPQGSGATLGDAFPWNAVLALPILDFTSASEPPCSSMMLPRYVKAFYIFQSFAVMSDWIVVFRFGIEDLGFPLVYVEAY
ncbi:unnamed protein product [Schistosoma margrebowiei]|uniref:Uncharacterized protein n=1 Tax=Schistosoma margrebowiei TaxID=48269 RepID=A0A3P7XAV1_9TREM|nr:unnamed protein product [Schistosoma margrebowiei]